MRMYLIGMKPQLPVEEAEALIKSVDFCGVCNGEPFFQLEMFSTFLTSSILRAGTRWWETSSW